MGLYKKIFSLWITQIRIKRFMKMFLKHIKGAAIALEKMEQLSIKIGQPPEHTENISQLKQQLNKLHNELEAFLKVIIDD